MDDSDLLLLHNAIHGQLDSDEEEEFFDQACLLTLVLIVGSNEDHAFSVENRRPRRQYLGRKSLLPNPRFGTPWTRLYESRDDRAFITTMGIDTSAFDSILNAGFGRLWDTRPIPRRDKSTAIQPRPGKRSLDAAGGLGLVLHWLSSTMRQVSLQQIFALVPSTVSRYLRFALSILLEVLRWMPHAAIKWPQGDEFLELSGHVSARHPLLQGVFGSIDGLKLPCQVSSDIEIENATYNGWLHSHFVSSVIVFSSTGLYSNYAYLLDAYHSNRRDPLLSHKLPWQLARLACRRGNLREAGTRNTGWLLSRRRHRVPYRSRSHRREDTGPTQSP